MRRLMEMLVEKRNAVDHEERERGGFLGGLGLKSQSPLEK